MIISDVFEKRQTIVIYTLQELLNMLEDNQLTLGKTNKVQVRMIRKYIVDNVLTEQIYLPPIVARLEGGSLDDGKPTQLTVIDGTQRMKALSQLKSVILKTMNSEDEEERKKGFKLHYTFDEIEVAVQVFEGLTTSEADQMYVDLNTKGKKVSLSKRIAYDSRNDINQATNRILQSNPLLRQAGVEQEKHSVMRPKNKKLLSLSQLRQLVALFVTGKTIASNLALETEVQLQSEENIELINTWFEELFKLYPVHSIGNYEVSMLASFPLLTAIATYAVEGMEKMSFEEKRQGIIERMRKLRAVTWERKNPIWREFEGSERGREKYYYLANNKKSIGSLVAWLRLKGGELN
ncbi:DNA sulfur modification protein DndB [Sporosarcina sp. FSL K6-1508]|uniref:DNA sulfur modification protein DndB n=1 Tax=Sporosarcina sp. FSL K6-1508 TaxID=2921553 RepID=UPI0030F4E762